MSKNKRLCFIFDLDGTLLDDVNIFHDILTNSIPERLKMSTKSEQVNIFFKDSLKIFTGRSSKWVIFKKFWKYSGALGFNLYEKFASLKIYKKEYKLRISHVNWFPYALETLNGLKKKGYYLALNTTSSTRELSDRFFYKKKELLLFNEIITRTKVKNLKPNPEGIFLIVQKLQVSIQNCIMIGDSDIDIEAGRNAGICTVLLLSGLTTLNNLNEFIYKPDFVFKDIAEFYHNINKIETFMDKLNSKTKLS